MRTATRAAAILCGLALAGCQTVQPAATSPPLTRADTTVAKASAELTRYCGLTRAALATVGLFAPPKVELAANYASVVVDTVCDAPPTDVRTALATVGRAYTAVVTASRE